MSRMLSTIVMWVLLLVSVPGLIFARSDTSPPTSLYLELRHTYRLEEMGTNIVISVSHRGEVIAADASRSKCYRIQPGGKEFEPFTLKGMDNRFVVPQALCHDDTDNLWVANPLGHEVLLLSPAGSLLRVFSPKEYPLEKPVAFACKGTGSVLVLDAGHQAVLEIEEKANTVVVTWIKDLPASSKPVGLTVEPDTGTVLVITDAGEVLRMDVQGNLKAFSPSIRERQSAIGGLKFGPNSLLFASDSSGPAVLAYDTGGRFIQDFPLVRPLLLHPTSLAIRGDDLWLVDEGKKVVYRFAIKTAVTGMEHQILGEEYLALHHPQEAATEFERASMLGLNSVELRLSWGQALYAVKEFQGALTQFNQASVQNSQDPQVAYWLGQTHNALGLKQDAEKDYIKTLSILPDHFLAHYHLGMLYLAENKLDLAGPHLTRALEIDPEDWQARIGMGRLYLSQKEYAQAREVFSSLSGSVDLLRQARYYIGLTYLGEGKPEAALPYLERASREGPFFSDAFYGLGNAYRLLNQMDNAEQSFRKALVINPQHADAKQALKEMQQQ